MRPCPGPLQSPRISSEELRKHPVTSPTRKINRMMSLVPFYLNALLSKAMWKHMIISFLTVS